jgi:hypothetical protein
MMTTCEPPYQNCRSDGEENNGDELIWLHYDSFNKR